VFNRKPKPIIGADTNGFEFKFNKFKIVSGETDEVVSFCGESLTLKDKESVEIKLKQNECDS
jgi:hypothetical protein